MEWSPPGLACVTRRSDPLREEADGTPSPSARSRTFFVVVDDSRFSPTDAQRVKDALASLFEMVEPARVAILLVGRSTAATGLVPADRGKLLDVLQSIRSSPRPPTLIHQAPR